MGGVASGRVCPAGCAAGLFSNTYIEVRASPLKLCYVLLINTFFGLNISSKHGRTKDTFGRKSVDRIVIQSMSRICNLCRLIVVDCEYAESFGPFLSGGNAGASHVVYIVPDDS